MSVDSKIKMETILSSKLYYLLTIIAIFNNFQSIHSFPNIRVVNFSRPHATESPEISVNVFPKHRYSKFNCGTTQFSCNDSCIPLSWKCDGTPDCKDNTDESGCKGCEAGSFKCANGKCIPINWLCDSEDDCSDKSDEVNCKITCPPSQFTCSIGNKCFDKMLQCNGITDCPDGSDEKECGHECSEKEFRCDDGTCIDKSFHCDQEFDCKDGSDEIGCATKIHRKDTKLANYSGTHEKPESSVDFMNLFNFWANLGAYSTIERVNTKNGSKMEILLKANSLSPIGLAISAENVKVYWINGTHRTLVNSNGLDKEKP